MQVVHVKQARLNTSTLLSVLVVMVAVPNTSGSEPDRDADVAARQLYAHHARALQAYVERFCADRASAEDVVQETFIRAWQHLRPLSATDPQVRPWLFRVARNLLIDADRAARRRPFTVQMPPAEQGRDDEGLNQVLDHELVTDALQRLSPAHRAVLVETFYRGGTLARVACRLGIPHGTARSRLHYALCALRLQLQDPHAIESR